MKAQALAIYDNGGKTWDRYTVIIGGDVYTMSENADTPGGFNQFMDRVENIPYNKHDKKKMFHEVPMETRNAIIQRLSSYNE